LPRQRDSAEVNHSFHGQRHKSSSSKAVPVNKPCLRPFVCLRLRNSDQHQNFRPPSALSFSSMGFNDQKILSRRRQLGPGLATRLPMHAISSSASPLHCPHAVFYAQDLRAMCRRLPVSPHYCKSRDRESTLCVRISYIYICGTGFWGLFRSQT